MLHDKRISLIIPCKNEEAALDSMLSKVPDFIDEIIVVDNNSTDNTGQIAKSYGAIVVKEKRKENGVGYGYAHQSGMKRATGDILVAMDGDDTYPIEAIRRVITYIERSKADFVSCARFPLTDNNAISGIRQLGVHILNLEVGILFGYPTRDILSGMWAMRKEIVHKLNATSGDWNFSPEVKLAALSNPEINFSEYHINHYTRLNGMSKQAIWETGFNHLFYILKRRLTADKQTSKQHARYIFKSLNYLANSAFAFLLFSKMK